MGNTARSFGFSFDSIISIYDRLFEGEEGNITIRIYMLKTRNAAALYDHYLT